MRLLKQVIIGVVVFSIILLLISFLLPSRISVSKTVLINASHQKVVNALMDIGNWKNWNPIMQDSTAKYTVISDRQMDWLSGDGTPNSLQLQQFAPDSIAVVIRSKDKQVFASGFTVVGHQQDSLFTKTEWWIDEHLAWYPWAKFYGLFSESFREAYIDNTLQKFKQYIESD